MTVYTALNAVIETVADVIDDMPDAVSTHWADCHLVHAACLAHLLCDLIEEEMKT